MYSVGDLVQYDFENLHVEHRVGCTKWFKDATHKYKHLQKMLFRVLWSELGAVRNTVGVECIENRAFTMRSEQYAGPGISIKKNELVGALYSFDAARLISARREEAPKKSAVAAPRGGVALTEARLAKIFKGRTKRRLVLSPSYITDGYAVRRRADVAPATDDEIYKIVTAANEATAEDIYPDITLQNMSDAQLRGFLRTDSEHEMLHVNYAPKTGLGELLDPESGGIVARMDMGHFSRWVLKYSADLRVTRSTEGANPARNVLHFWRGDDLAFCVMPTLEVR